MIAAAAAAKLLQSCLTLCDPIDGSPPGSPVPPGNSEGQGSLSPWMSQTVRYDLVTGHIFLVRGSDIKSMLRNFLKPNDFL